MKQSDVDFARDEARQVWLAASNSRPAAKAAADYVCTGTNEELVIQSAIDDCAASGRQLFMFAGLYRLDAVRDFGDGGPPAAVVIRNMHRAFELYGFTFGNYPYHCAFNHPITMINCCDEQNVNMPLFVSCGDNGGDLHGLQEVTMVSFNFERVAAHVLEAQAAPR